MSVMASQITSLKIVSSTVYSDADRRKHQSSASLAFVGGIHWWPVNSPHKWPALRKMFPFDDVIMSKILTIDTPLLSQDGERWGVIFITNSDAWVTAALVRSSYGLRNIAIYNTGPSYKLSSTRVYMHTCRCVWLVLLWLYNHFWIAVILHRHLDNYWPMSVNMMTSSNGNIFRVTGHLCGEFTGPRWIPHTKASDAELWCLLWSAPE